MADKTSTNTQDYYAALDIGSNSFHFVLARLVENHLQILHSEKYSVQLAKGLNKDLILSESAISRALVVLEKLATTTAHIKTEQFRAVATFTLRQANNSGKFLKAAAKVFPFTIEIISGHEEARLIYQGVAHHRQTNDKQLVIDIGGGSTECIIGEGYKINQLDSLNIGCVSFRQRYFPNGNISSEAFEQAIKAASHEVDAIAKRFKKCGWQQVIGTSGTIKAIARIINAGNNIPRPFNLNELKALKKQLVTFNHTSEIYIEGLKENRREVICSGVAVLIAVMQCLEIDRIEYCQYALREGVLFEQLENAEHNNVRQRTIDNFIQRFNIDRNQIGMVDNVAMTLFKQSRKRWRLKESIYQDLLHFACQLHEIGIDINASGYQKHGQYILEQADLAGFNREQQRALAWLVGNQRKKITPIITGHWYLLSPQKLYRLCILLRLSVLLNQQRKNEDDEVFIIECNTKKVTLFIKGQWLIERPVIDTELFYEAKAINKLGYKLTIVEPIAIEN